MRVTGLDLSLRRTGVAHVTWEPAIAPLSELVPAGQAGLREVWAKTTRVEPGTRRGTGHERLDFVLREVGRHTRRAELVMVEAPFAKGDQATQLSGLFWLVTHGLWRRGQPVAVVGNSQVKVYATGRGRVDKDEVLAAVIKRYPDVEVAGNDGADALVLAALGAHYLGHPLQPVPATHSRVLETVDWPVSVRELRGRLHGNDPAAQA